MCNVIPSHYKKADVSCSCTKCDGAFCAANKNVTRNCSCEDCSGSNTCLFSSSHKLSESRSDATNGYRSLPTVVSDVARYIASSVVHLVPQFNCSRCYPTTCQNNTGTNTVELYRKLNSAPPKYTMEQLKKTYLTPQKNKVSAPVITCDTDVCQTDQEDFLPKRTIPSDRTNEIYRTEILKQKLAAEALKNIYVPGRASKKRPEELSCHFDKCSKYMLEKPAGFTMDLNKNNQISQFPENEAIKPAKKFTRNFELFTHILDSDWNTIETPGYPYSKNSQNCECTECVESKNKTNVVLFEPPGYVLDLPTATLHKKYLSHSKSCTCEIGQDDNKNVSKGKCKCEKHKPEPECIKCVETKDSNYNTSGYVIELATTTTPKKTCADSLKESCFPKSMFYSYQCQEQRPTHRTERKNTDNASKSLFYSRNRKIRNTQELYQVSLPPENSYNFRKRDSCECNASRKNRTEPTGYVLELEQYKPTKNAQQLVKDVLVTQGRLSTTIVVDSLPDVKKGCDCSGKSNSKHEIPGFVVDVPKCDDDKRCRGFGLPKTNMEMPRYPFELPKYDNTPGNTEKKKCECMKCESAKSKDPSSSSSGLVLELPKFLKRMKKQRNDACGCQDSETNKRTFNDNNSSMNEDYNSRGTAKSLSSGYVMDLSKFKGSARKETCSGCQDTDKNRSGYVLDLPRTNPIPKSFNQDTCGCPNSKKDSSNKLSKDCICKGTSKCKSSSASGFVLDLPTTKSMGKTDSCACSNPSKQTVTEYQSNKSQKYDYVPCRNTMNKNPDVFGNKTKECGYVFDLTTIRSQKGGNNCDCREGKNKFASPISKQTGPKSCSCCKCPQTTQSKPPSIPQKSSCECRESSGNKEDLSKYVYVLPKQSNTSKTTSNCECRESRNKLNQPISTPMPGYTDKNKKGLVNTERTFNSGFVMDLKTSVGNKKSCACPPSSQNRSELAGYILDLPKHKSIDHKPEKCECTTKKKSRSKANQIYRVETAMISPETHNVCNDILGKKSDTHELFKNFKPPPKKHIDLCKNILKTQTEAIETLKKIYLPQQEFSKTPRNLSSDNNTKIQCPKESQLTDAEVDEAAHLLSTAMLSAEVMNLPYTEFTDSLASKRSDTDKPTRLSKYDIYQRIKEAYKACSCKVCECIPGKQGKSETCEYNECLNCPDKTDTKTSNVEKFQRQNCTNKSLRTLHGTNNQQMCDCKPCNCAECTRTMAKLCGCEPCQCVECKTRSLHQRQTLVVAPVGREENVQRLACTCSPCDCIECGLVQPLAANAVHEMSTAINRHARCRCEICLNEVCDQSDLDSCSCPRRNKVMSKPVEKTTHDFDIRTATTNQSKPLYSQRRNKSPARDTIAMYAAVSTNYHALTSNDDISSKAEICDCDECECLNCICQEESVLNIKSSQLFSSSRTITKSDLNVRSKSILNSYEDYKFYKRQNDNNQCDFTSASYFTEDCECDACECVKCGRDTNISCQSVKSKIPYDKNYREEIFDTAKPLIKKGEILTPSTHRFRVQNQEQNSNALDVSTKEKSKKRLKQKSTISHKLTNQSSKLSKQSSKISPSIKLGSITNANLSDINKPRTVNRNNSLDNEMSIYFSGYSSFETSPNTSQHRKYGGSTSPMSRNKHKSWESSCNSSGHDYPEYLIQFPQLTADTSNLKDEMEINSYQTKSLDRSNISPKSDSNNIITDKLSCDDISTKENSTVNSEMTSKKQIKSNKLQQKLECHESNNNCDKIFCFRDVAENVVTASSQFYKLEMTNKINYYKNKKIKYITDKDKLQDARLFIHNRYSLKTDRKKTKYFNFINNCNNFYLARKEFDADLPQKKTASALLPVHREGHNMYHQKCIPRPSFNNTDITNAVDFKRVRKTLREANEFSLKLMKLLNMYENANKEFESISDKLKISHARLISGDFEVKKEEKDKNKKIKDSRQDQKKCYDTIENELHELPAEHNTDLQIPTKPEKDNSDSQTVRHDTDSSPAVAETVKLNVLEEIESKLNADERFSSDMPKKETIQKNDGPENIQAKESVIDDSVNRMQDTSVEKNKRARKKEEINKKSNKKNKMPKRKVIISKRISVRNSNEMKGKAFTKYRITVGTSTTALSDKPSKTINEPNAKRSVNFSAKVVQQTRNEPKHYNDLKQIMKKLDSVFAGIEEIPVSTSTETSELDNHMNNYARNNIGVTHEIKEKSPWPILRKNFSWSARSPTNNNEYSNFPSMDLEVKQTVQSISQHTPSQPKKRHENKALASLQVEVQKLLDMPILQSQQCNQCPKETTNTQPEMHC